MSRELVPEIAQVVGDGSEAPASWGQIPTDEAGSEPVGAVSEHIDAGIGPHQGDEVVDVAPDAAGFAGRLGGGVKEFAGEPRQSKSASCFDVSGVPAEERS